MTTIYRLFLLNIFELTPKMLAKNWSVPYEYANWDFNDVAARILHKYSQVFALEEANDRRKDSHE